MASALDVHDAKYGSYTIPAVESITVEYADGEAAPIRQGYGGRTDREGTRAYSLTTLHGGLGILRGSEVAHGTRYRYNEGLMTHMDNGMFLPYAVTAQAAESANDISGVVAANLRVSMVNSTLGGSNPRPYFALKNKFKRAVGDSDSAGETTGLSLTDSILCMTEGKANSTRYIICGTNGATDDVFGIADPTLSPPGKTTIFALSAGDSVWGVWSMPNLGPGYMVYAGKIGGNSGLHYLATTAALLTAPTQMPLTATVGVEGNIALVTSAEMTLSQEQDANGNWAWGATTASTQIEYGYEYGFPSGDFDAVPDDALIKAHQVKVTLTETNVVVGAAYDGAVIIVNGSVRSIKFGADDSVTSTVTKTSGNTTNNTLGAAITGAELKSGAIRVGPGRASGDGAGGADGMDITAIKWQVAYRLTGTAAAMTLGGFAGSPDPNDEFAVYAAATEFQDDASATTVPRLLWKFDHSYDAGNNRPTVSVGKVPTGLRHVETFTYSAGGIVVAGDTSSGLAKVCKLLLPGRTPTETGFNSKDQGFTEDWGIANLWPCDQGFIAQMVNTAGTVMQDWIWRADNSAFSPISKRETITSTPIRYVRADVGHHLRRRYRFYATTTNTSVSRIFQPRNMYENPLNNNTSEVKEDGPLYLITPDTDIGGPPERNKAVLVAWFLGRDISSTNTVKLEHSSDGGSTWATWTTFTSFGSKSVLTTPVAFRYLMFRVSLNHTAAGTGTPNGLGPILIELYSGWRKVRVVTIDFDADGREFRLKYERGAMQLYSLLQTQENTLPVQTLRLGADTFLASMAPMVTRFRPKALGERTEPVPDPKGRLHRLEFMEATS